MNKYCKLFLILCCFYIVSSGGCGRDVVRTREQGPNINELDPFDFGDEFASSAVEREESVVNDNSSDEIIVDTGNNESNVLLDHSKEFQTNGDSTVIEQSYENIMGYRVQLGAFEKKENAEKLKNRASSKLDLPIYIEYQAPFFRVRLGNFIEKSDAERYVRLLKDEGFSDARWVSSYINIQR